MSFLIGVIFGWALRSLVARGHEAKLHRMIDYLLSRAARG